MKETKELRNITIGAMLEETAAKYPKVQAVKYIETEFTRTWEEFNATVDRIAKGLLYMGFKKGDHAAVWAVNLPQWLTLFFAAAKIGVIIVTVNTNYKEKELEFILKDSDSKALFICDQLRDIDCEKTIYSLCPGMLESDESDKWNINAKNFPKLRMLISFDNYYEKMFHWNEIESLGKLIPDWQYEKAKSRTHPDDVITLLYTSGTTGFPKGVMLTHNNLVNNGQAIGDGMHFTEKDRLCIPVPFFHCFGLTLSILAAATHGATMIPLLWFTPMKVMHTIEYEKCTAVNGVPTMFIGILSHRDFEKYNYSTLRTGIMAGANCPEKVLRDVSEKMNLTEIVSVYGLTEASPGCTMTKADDTFERRVTTVGAAFPHVKIKIIDAETKKEVGLNMPGELCTSGYHLMKGYYNNEEGTNSAIEIIDSERWLHTGDLAEVDEYGYYKITGRIKDMIIRGGENISPKELEDVIRTFKGVKDVAVVSAPSEKYGERVCAVIVPEEGINPEVDLKKEAIRDFVGKNLARHKVPSYVEFINELPLTASGKIQKYILRDMIKEMKENGTLVRIGVINRD